MVTDQKTVYLRRKLHLQIKYCPNHQVWCSKNLGAHSVSLLWRRLQEFLSHSSISPPTFSFWRTFIRMLLASSSGANTPIQQYTAFTQINPLFCQPPQWTFSRHKYPGSFGHFHFLHGVKNKGRRRNVLSYSSFPWAEKQTRIDSSHKAVVSRPSQHKTLQQSSMRAAPPDHCKCK